MATDPIISIPDPSVVMIDPKTGRWTQDGYQLLALLIKKLNQL